MRSIIFANVLPQQTSSLTATVNYEQHAIKFLDDLALNLWDCGGQNSFMESYFAQAEQVFSSVACVIYVFDVDSKDQSTAFQFFRRTVDALSKFSPIAQLFCLIHKMDLVPQKKWDSVFQKWDADLRQASRTVQPQAFATTIWNESLYNAWSAIVNALIPRRDLLQKQLSQFLEVCDAREALLFERSTFLVVASASLHPPKDPHRLEKLSNIIKQFKLSCTKHQTHFTYMEMRNSLFLGIIAELTPNTVILLVTDRSVPIESMSVNITQAKEHFGRIFAAMRA